MDFSDALRATRFDGKKIARSGWSGEGQYVVYREGYPDGIAINASTAKATGLPEGIHCGFLAYLMFCTPRGEFVPWVASQTDILSEDWCTV